MPYPFLHVAEAAQGKNECYIHFSHQGGDAPLSLVQFGWHKTAGGYGYGPMVRDHCLIHFVLKGTGRVLASDMEYRVGPGECFAFFPHQIAYYESDKQDPWEYYWLGFEGGWSDDLMKEAGFSEELIVRSIVEEEKLFALMQSGIDLGMRAENALYFLGTLQQVLHHLISHRAAAEERMDSSKRMYNPLGNEYVRIVTSIIETSYRERLSVDEMASRMGLNRSYLTTLFKEHTGMPIKEYLMEYRLQQSILRLQRTNYTVKQSALESGFNDPLYYSRLFKARYGVSPHDYRAAQERREGCEEDCACPEGLKEASKCDGNK
jgi:AraC-like DNA-binding protein